jgi:hypothetical protein
MEHRMSLVVGIDPGVTTGYAEWDAAARMLRTVEGLKIHVAMQRVAMLHMAGNLSHVVFEDARMRTYFGERKSHAEERARLQGAGSVKRDSTIWEDFLTDLGVPIQAVSPQEKGAKYNAAGFARLTRWEKPTNEHGRDAALLVFGTKAKG